MVAINMEMPKYCWGYDIESKKWKECPIYKGCKHHSSNIETMPSDCPLVEIEERKHGKWEHDKLFGECAYVCSFCHTIWTSSEIQNMHYCPTCGAEMKGEEE